MEKQELIDALKQHSDDIKAKQEALKTANDAKAAELKAEIDAMVQKSAAVQAQLDDISTKLAKAEKSVKVEGNGSLESGIKQLLASEEFKAAKADKFRNAKTFEIKADTGDITGTVNMTQQNLTVKFAAENELAFLPYLNTGTVGASKGMVLWMEGAYTSNVGYVGEGTGSASADTAAVTEKTRAMAKISAKLPLTAELLEDAEYIASALRMKLQEKAMLFVDSEFYGGAGVDTTHPNWIYGIKSQATAYSLTTAGGTAHTVDKANVGDLVDAVITQAEVLNQRGLNILWINPKDFRRFKTAKDLNGQYLFIKDVNGTYTINGLNVVKSNQVTANTMTIANSSKIQAWWKRNPEIKFSQMNGTDFVDDAYTAVMFLRCQCVIEAADATAVIHVSDIDAAIAELASV